MNIARLIRRFLLPRSVLSIYHLLTSGCRISPRAEVEFNSHLSIGRGSEIGSFTKIKASDGPLRIGKNTFIGTGCFVSAGEQGVEIGDDCLISPHVSIISNSYRFSRIDIPIREQGSTSKGVRIGNGVWLGTGARILDGAIIGEGAIITAGTVVSGRVPPLAVFGGNPGTVVFLRR